MAARVSASNVRSASNAKQLTRRIGPFRVEVTSAGWWIDFRGAVVSALLVSDSSLRNGFIYGSQEYIGRMAEQKEMALLVQDQPSVAKSSSSIKNLTFWTQHSLENDWGQALSTKEMPSGSR